MTPDTDPVLLWCVKVPVQQTQTMKQQLLSLGLFLKDYKLIKEQSFVFLPITLPTQPPADWILQERLFEPYERPQSYHDSLKLILPSELHQFIPSSFDRLGDCILVKLDPALDSFKEQVGKTLKEQFSVRSVFTKGSDVESEFRTIDWQCIAGEDNPVVLHAMHGLVWKVNIREVYFNTRLSNEYLRIAHLVHDQDIIIDMFAGIGPFALLCAHTKQVQVYALDINPTAIELLKDNITRNQKLLIGTIMSACGDSRELIKDLPQANSIIMNLPGYASEFLELTIPHILTGGTIFLHQFVLLSKEEKKQPLTKQTNELYDQLNNITHKLKLSNYSWEITYNILRDVSPSKVHVVWDITRTI